MMAKKKEEGYKRRKNRGIDIINDNDDIIDQLIQDMRAAAEVIIFDLMKCCFISVLKHFVCNFSG